MMEYEKQFKNFVCAKCRGRSPYFEEITLGTMPKRFFSKNQENKFVMVICGLCGYTEMYSLKVVANIKEEVPAKNTPSPVIEKEAP